MRTRCTAGLLTFTVAIGVGCDSDAPHEAPAAATSAKPPAMPGNRAGASLPAATAGGIVGEVVETMDSGGYTYVLADTGSASVWAAGPPVAVSTGDTVRFGGSMLMTDYHSRTLDRTFDRIYFAGAIEVIAAGPAAGKDAADAGDTPSVAPSVAPAEGGVTVEQVFTQRAELVGTEIVLRGEVVKYNGGILGANWLHVRDGTGAEGSNDLTVTTSAAVAVGDTVTVRGVLAADKDFGSGYFYDLIIEGAQVSVD